MKTFEHFIDEAKTKVSDDDKSYAAWEKSAERMAVADAAHDDAYEKAEAAYDDAIAKADKIREAAFEKADAIHSKAEAAFDKVMIVAQGLKRVK